MIRSHRTLSLAGLACAALFSFGAVSFAGVRPQQNPSAAPAQSAAAAKDYVLLERVRFLDKMGFDQPVEAFSLLLPSGWKSEGGVTWKSINACRGEMITGSVRAESPDGKLSFQMLPARSFGFSDDPMLRQTLLATAQAGGCGVNQPFSAEQYVEGFARLDLGATASNIQRDERRAEWTRQLDEQANASARQFGLDHTQETTFARGNIAWPDKSAGILEAGVTNVIMRHPNLLTGGFTTQSTTMVFYCVLVRYPTGREEEARKLLALATNSHRVNPVWNQAKEQFLTQLGNVEHAGRMERIRLMGEQSQAYARAQSDASDRSMRSWERRQDAQDQQHERFVKTIREVETWSDGDNGRVELTSGFSHAWSRGDGSYILSNDPNFNPSSVFQDQAWKAMSPTR